MFVCCRKASSSNDDDDDSGGNDKELKAYDDRCDDGINVERRSNDHDSVKERSGSGEHEKIGEDNGYGTYVEGHDDDDDDDKERDSYENVQNYDERRNSGDDNESLKHTENSVEDNLYGTYVERLDQVMYGNYYHSDYEFDVSSIDETTKSVMPESLRSYFCELDHIQFGEKLGNGAFGEVFRGTLNGKKRVAIKCLELSHAQRTFPKATVEDITANFFWEAAGMVGLNHCCVVEMVAIGMSLQRKAIVYELCNGGDLQSCIQRGGMLESDMVRIALELSSGLTYLHEQGRVHRDVKPENVLLSEEGHAKFCDLGVAQLDFTVSSEQQETDAVAAGVQDLRYGSPEVLSGKLSLPTKASDIYSLGLTMLHMCRGSLWPKKTPLKDVIRCIASNSIENVAPISAEWTMATVIRECLQTKPKDRPSAARVYDMLTKLPNIDPLVVLRHATRLDVKEDEHYVANFVSENRALQRIVSSEQETSMMVVTSAIESFIASPSQNRVLVLFGDGGTGKSTAMHHACVGLVRDVQSDALMVFVRSGIDEWSYSGLNDGINKVLVHHGCENVSKDSKIVFVVDGYDELKRDLPPKPIDQLLGLSQWPHALVVVTCRRTTVAQRSESLHFGQSCKKLYVLPFTEYQIKAYMKSRGVATTMVTSDLLQLVENPLLLSLYTSCSSYVQLDSSERVRRRHIYDAYVRWWYERFKRAVPNTEVVAQSSLTLSSFYKCVAQVALRMFSENVLSLARDVMTRDNSADDWFRVRSIVRSAAVDSRQRLISTASANLSRRVILSVDEYANMRVQELDFVLSVCPLRFSATSFTFTHKTFFEYFTTIGFMSELQCVIAEQHQMWRKSLVFSSRLLTSDSGLLSFVAEFVNVDVGQRFSLDDHHQEQQQQQQQQVAQECFTVDTVEFTENLWHTVYSTRAFMEDVEEELCACTSGANAISALNVGGVSFSGRDLSDCRFGYPHLYRETYDGGDASGCFADLSASMLCRSNLCGANLSGCRLEQACLDGANVCGANLSSVVWGQMPSLSGHTDSVVAIAVSTDSKLLVSGSWDRSVRVWNADKCVHVLNGHDSWIRSVALLPNGKRVVSGDESGKIIVWSTLGGLRVGTFENAHEDCVSGLAFSIDGRFLYSSSWDRTVKKWDLKRTSSPLEVYHNFSDRITTIALNTVDECSLFCACLESCTMRQIDTDGDGGDIMREFVGHTKPINCIVVSRERHCVFTGSSDCTIREWSITDGQHLRTFSESTDRILGIAVMSTNSDTMIYGASKNRIIFQWSLDSGELMTRRYGHTEQVNCVAVTRDSTRLLSGDAAGSIRQWDLSTQIVLRGANNELRGRVRCVALSTDQRSVFTGSSFRGQLSRWSTIDGRLLSTNETNFGVWSVCVCSAYVFAGGSKGWLCQWDLATGRRIRLWQLTGAERVDQTIEQLVVSNDGQSLFVLPSVSKVVHQYDTVSGVDVRRFSFSIGGVRRLVLSRDDSTLIVGGKLGCESCNVSQSAEATAETRPSFNVGWIRNIVMTSDESHMFAASLEQIVYMHVSSGDVIRTIVLPCDMSRMVLSHDDRFLFVACRDGLIRQYAMESGDKCIAHMKYSIEEKGMVSVGMCLSMDGTKLFTCSSADQTLRCFSLSESSPSPQHMCVWIAGSRVLSSMGIQYDQDADSTATKIFDELSGAYTQ